MTIVMIDERSFISLASQIKNTFADKESRSSVIFHKSGALPLKVETMGVRVPGLQTSLGYRSLPDERPLLLGTGTAGAGTLRRSCEAFAKRYRNCLASFYIILAFS